MSGCYVSPRGISIAARRIVTLYVESLLSSAEAEKPTGIHERLLKVHGEAAVDVNEVRRCLRRI